MEIGGTRMCLGLSGFSVPAVWSCNTILSQPWNQRIVYTWDILDIKIPKPPHIRFPKIIGFVQFFYFFGSVREILKLTVSSEHPVPNYLYSYLDKSGNANNIYIHIWPNFLTYIIFLSIFGHYKKHEWYSSLYLAKYLNTNSIRIHIQSRKHKMMIWNDTFNIRGSLPLQNNICVFEAFWICLFDFLFVFVFV